MLLTVLILGFFNSQFIVGNLDTWKYTGNEPKDILERWGVSRSRRDKLLKQAFADLVTISCGGMHRTAKTPFVAIVLYKASGRLLCMGSILDYQHILTARKCYRDILTKDLLVLAGYYKAYWGEYSQVIQVDKIVRDEVFLAILKLSTKLLFNKYVGAARLLPSYTKKELDIEDVIKGPYKVAGFHVDRYDVPGDYISKDKTYEVVEDKIVSIVNCVKNYPSLAFRKQNVFCVKGNATFCWGGYGSPVLKWMSPNPYFVQVGVIVYDNCTTDLTAPYIVARTDVHAEWIEENSLYTHQAL